jgi:peptidoglycan/xylan/chitin deacetylase (PgdA/CDA1 family)
VGDAVVLRVFLTVDTEVWPVPKTWPHTPLSADQPCDREVEVYLHGGEVEPRFGIAYQLATLARNKLKATFFVDPLFSFALGLGALVRVLQPIGEHGQEVALHMHPEWLTDPRCVGLPDFAGPCLWQYGVEDQRRMMHAGLARLAEAGAGSIRAFRAGNYAANRATLTALRETGIPIDTSLNVCYAESFPDLAGRDEVRAPSHVEEIVEFPVTSFVDRPPRGRRHLQLAACSLTEIRYVLEQAAAARWSTVVIVMHSYELMRVGQFQNGGPATHSRLLVRRFERLCEYLAANRDRMRTSHFSDIDLTSLEDLGKTPDIVSSPLRTRARQIEQLISKFL